MTIITIAVILFVGALAPVLVLTQDADAAMTSKGTSNQVTNSKMVCGDKLCSEWEGGREGYEKLKSKAVESIEEKISEIEREQEMGEKKVQTESTLKQQLEKIQAKIDRGQSLSAGEVQTLKKIMNEYTAQETAEGYYSDRPAVETGTPSYAEHSFGLIASGTITSQTDPGKGHETHQLSVILPPSENIYVGKLTFSASEPVQYVTLHGPLAEGEDMGQPIWSPDGETKYALTFIDNGQASGGWYFAGNALALHTMNDEPFTATHSVAYAEIPQGVYSKGTVETKTIHSMQDPGLGHENHSIALILPPREIPYQGAVLAYSASENVQLVALNGPLSEDEMRGQPTWTMDGETHYALTLVPGDNIGIWTTFSGTALAVHTPNPDGFTVSYTVAGLH